MTIDYIYLLYILYLLYIFNILSLLYFNIVYLYILVNIYEII